MDYRAIFITPLAALALSVGATSLQMPEGWQASKAAARADIVTGGYNGEGYEVGIDSALAGSSPSMTLRSIARLNAEYPNVGRAYQSVSGYAGQRVRFSGQLRAAAAGGWAGLYLGLGDNDVLMAVTQGETGVEKRLPMGAAVPAADGQWHEVSVVLDVPADAPWLTLGMAQVGEGQVWVRDLTFDVVGPEVPVTTTPIGIDWAQARRFHAQARATMAQVPPQPLRNAALD